MQPTSLQSEYYKEIFKKINMRHDIIWLCNRAMRFQSKTHVTPLLAIESTVAQWLEHPTSSRRVVGSNPIWNSDFFRVDVFTLKISLKNFFEYFLIILTLEVGWLQL